MSNVARINPVGVINEIIPRPKMYAEMITSLGRPTASASGAIIGIDNVARPEDELIKNPKITKMNIIKMMKIEGFMPSTIDDSLNRIVSETAP